MKPYQILQEMEFELCFFGNFQPSETMELGVSEIDWMHSKLVDAKRKELEIETAKRGMNA
jgi:hypothetical protein